MALGTQKPEISLVFLTFCYKKENKISVILKDELKLVNLETLAMSSNGDMVILASDCDQK